MAQFRNLFAAYVNLLGRNVDTAKNNTHIILQINSELDVWENIVKCDNWQLLMLICWTGM